MRGADRRSAPHQKGEPTVKKTVGGKKIVVRKPGAVRLTALCTNYGYGNCCCI
ncbi:hypothetical protein ACFY00_30480 [Kitasatospora sp. NPDC001540]|uniref:hypothetical protein n=1 Tax=Kitasatospora sp. NPDC001540 TaxID=3364014 RepID=UPI0036872F41